MVGWGRTAGTTCLQLFHREQMETTYSIALAYQLHHLLIEYPYECFWLRFHSFYMTIKAHIQI